jgi:hypothetical protein
VFDSIVILTIGIFGALFYGSHLVKNIQTNQTSSHLTIISQVNDQNLLEFKIIFAIVMLVSLEVLVYEAILILFNRLFDFINKYLFYRCKPKQLVLLSIDYMASHFIISSMF